MFFAGPKAGTQRKSQALAMAQSLDLHPEADLPAPSHLLASSPLEHLPPLLSSVHRPPSSAKARVCLLYLYKPVREGSG